MINLFYVGRFVIRGKRIDKLLKLSNLLDDLDCEYNFRIFADVDKNSVEYKMFEKNDKFNFFGFKKDWFNYLEKDSIMIFVTDYEGCPLSILEAYKYGHKKISLLKIPGIENYVSPNCISQDVEEMAMKIKNSQDFENFTNLESFYDKNRFDSEVSLFFNLI